MLIISFYWIISVPVTGEAALAWAALTDKLKGASVSCAPNSMWIGFIDPQALVGAPLGNPVTRVATSALKITR